MSSVFPDISVNRVDIKNQTIKIYASIDTVNSTVRPFWLEEEDFAQFISCEFLIFADPLEPLTELGSDAPFAEQAFNLLRLPFQRAEFPEVFEAPKAKISLQEIRQSPYGQSIGDRISMDFATSRIHFELEYDVASIPEVDGTSITEILQGLNATNENMTINMIYYSHVNIDEIEENYGIRNGQSEIRRLGGIAKYQPLAFLRGQTKKVFSEEPNIVSIQLDQDGETPFEGYYGLPAVLESEDETVSLLPGPGLPDPDVWRSRIDYDSIYGSGIRIENFLEEEEAVRAIKKQLALKTSRDHSYALMHYFSWNSRQSTIDQQDFDNIGNVNPNRAPSQNPTNGDVDAYSSLFTFDNLEMIKNMSPLGFLLNRDYSKLDDAQYQAMVADVMQKSRIEKLKITRKRLSNSPTVSNKAGTPEYKISHQEDDSMVLTRLGVEVVNEDFQFLRAQFFPRSTENLNFFHSNTMVLHDLELYRKGKQGQKYKYYIELSLFDGVPSYLFEKITELKEKERIIKNLLAAAGGLKATSDPSTGTTAFEGNLGIPSIVGVDPGDVIVTQNYDFSTEQWSADFQNRDYSSLSEAIQLYFLMLSLLGIETNQDPVATEQSILPSEAGTLESLELFYKSFRQVEKALILMYDKVTNLEEGVGSEIYGTKRMVPSNTRTNILDACFYTPDVITIEPRQGLVADFRNLTPLSTDIRLPRELYLEAFDTEKRVSSPIIYQNTQNQMTVFQNVENQIEKYDYLLDYLTKERLNGAISSIDSRIVKSRQNQEDGVIPLNLDVYKRKIANITDYLPSTTFETPSISKSFRVQSERIAQDNDGLESESFSFLESAIIGAMDVQGDLNNYIGQILSNLDNENLISYFSLDTVGAANLKKITTLMKTLESFQEEYNKTSPMATQPTDQEGFTSKYTPPIEAVTIIDTNGAIKTENITEEELSQAVFVYIDKGDQKYKKLMTTIVNNAKY